MCVRVCAYHALNNRTIDKHRSFNTREQQKPNRNKPTNLNTAVGVVVVVDVVDVVDVDVVVPAANLIRIK